ncbi:hypothetical protein ACFV2U_01665 [Streptomyces sp. NPDC059697]|uniref:hypothetical protein n=1 Tax=Streptomyces sp. NPDC059697 TaxID=3346912 RepID=UPI003688543D
MTTNRLEGVTEKLIPTSLGLINVRVGAEATNPNFLESTDFVLNDDPKSVAWALRSILIGRKDEHRRLNTIMADSIEGSTFRMLQHTAHLAARENPEGVNAEVDAFLAALPAAA